MARPHPPKDSDGGQGRGQWRRSRVVQGVEQAIAISPNLEHVSLALRAGLGQTRFLDSMIVACVPLGRGESTQPSRGGCRDGIEGRTQCLGQELDPVEVANSRQYVRAVGALTAPRLEQALIARGVKDAGQQAFARSVLQEPAPELAQEAVVEAGIDEVERQQVLPVDPSSDGLGGLAIAQAFSKLHQRDEGQTLGRVGRLPARRIEVGKRRGGEDGTEAVPQQQVGIAAAKRGSSDPSGVLRHRREHGLRAERHEWPPGGTATLHPDHHRSEFANRARSFPDAPARRVASCLKGPPFCRTNVSAFLLPGKRQFGTIATCSSVTPASPPSTWYFRAAISGSSRPRRQPPQRSSTSAAPR